MSATDAWATVLRENERETVISTFLMVMESDEYRDRVVGEAASEIAGAVGTLYERIGKSVAGRVDGSET